MEILVTYLTRRAKGGVSRRSEALSCDEVRFGRNTGLEAYLPDPRVRLEHAAMRANPCGLLIEALGLADLRVNGSPAKTHLGQPGDVLGIGPYDVTIVAPPAGKDAGLEVELVRPLGDDYAKLLARSNLSLASLGLNLRLWSWTGFILALVISLAMPVF